MGYLDSIKNSYFHKLKEILEPAFHGKAEIVEPVDEYKNIAVLKHAFGEIPVTLQGSSRIKIGKYGSFETWEEGRAIADQVVERIDVLHKMSISNMAQLEEKWLAINNKLTEIWKAKPGKNLKYSMQGSDVFICTHEKGSQLSIDSHTSKSDHIMSVHVEIVVNAASSWEEKLLFNGKSTTRYTRRLDGVFDILDSDGENAHRNHRNSINAKDAGTQLNLNHDNVIFIAHALGFGSPTLTEINKALTPTQRGQRHSGYYGVSLSKLDPDGNSKIHTDYGIAGYAVKGRKLIVQLFDIPIKFEMLLPVGQEIDQDKLLKDINSTFEKQFLKYRSRDSWNVNPKKGKFESFDKKLNDVFTIKEAIKENIEVDVFNHVKSALRKILAAHKLDDVEVEPGKKLPKHFIIAKLKKPGSGFWIVLGRGGQIYVKPGGFSGKQVWISSDQQLAEEITTWYSSDVSKRHVPKVSQNAYQQQFTPTVRTAPNERFPGQEKLKDIEKSKYFPRTVYHREGPPPGGLGSNTGVPGRTPFMLSIHATESLVDFTGSDEKGKLPAGLFTGLDLHAVSTSGIRPGHVGWIGGFYDETTLHIVEAQSDIMQRTWDLIDRSKRDEDTSVGSGKKKQIVRSQKHRIREISSELKNARVELAQMQQKDYGNLSEKYKLLERIQDLNTQLNSARVRYKKFTRMPMFSQYKSQLENMFKNWIQAFYADAFSFARSKKMSEIKIISTDGVKNMHANVNIGKDRESSIYHRLYDKIAMELGAEREGKWWKIPLKSIPTTESLDDRLQSLINEAIYGNKATVFHKTSSPDKILSIAKWGFFPSLSGAHGQGLYAVFDPDQNKSSWLQAGSYGSFVVKMAVDLRNKILILDRDEARKFYGENYKISDQLDQMGVDWRKTEMSEFDQWEVHKKVDYTDVQKTVMEMDVLIEKGAQIPPRNVSFSSLRFEVNGIFFLGGHGHELVGFDTSIYKPLSFSHISDRSLNSINDLQWHKFNQEGIDYIYSVASKQHNLPPKSHWYRQL